MKIKTADEIEVPSMRRIKPTLIRECPRCGLDRAIALPEHPAGISTCTACGLKLDLFDDEALQRRDYLECYEEVR